MQLLTKLITRTKRGEKEDNWKKRCNCTFNMLSSLVKVHIKTNQIRKLTKKLKQE